jgi:hypothetical protein
MKDPSLATPRTFDKVQCVLRRISASAMLMCDSKPVNFLMCQQRGVVWAIDYDREHVLDPVHLPRTTLLLLHNLLLYMHVAACEHACLESGASRASLRQWRHMFASRILCLNLSASGENEEKNVECLLRQRFLRPGTLRMRTEPQVLGMVADNLQRMICS